MSIDLRLQRSQWFYDDGGYYSYVLLNASKSEYNKIQQILKESGLRVLLAGKSYRPASNGIQYQWYIRVSDETGKHPSLKRIEQILAVYEPINEQDVASKDEDIRKFKAILDEKERQYQALLDCLESFRKHNQELLINYERTQIELNKYKDKAEDLELQLQQIRESALIPGDIEEIHQKYESTIKELRQELNEKQRDFNSWINSFESDIHNRDQKITELHNQISDLQNQIEILKAEKNQTIIQHQDTQSSRITRAERENPEYLFRAIINMFLPNIHFLGGTLDTLWREMRNPIKTLEQLKDLSQIKAKRVRRTEDWLERHIEGNWRLYFRKNGNSQYQVLISHKNTQESDIEWLMHQ